MSFDNDEKISLLFKKLVGKPCTSGSIEFYNEPSLQNRPVIFDNQIYQEAVPSSMVSSAFNGTSHNVIKKSNNVTISTNGKIPGGTVNNVDYSSITKYVRIPLIQLVNGRNDAWVAPTTITSQIPTVEVTNLLKDTIPFTFGNGTYTVILEKKTTVGNTFVSVPLEIHEWFLDTDVGVLTFFGSTFSTAFSPSGTYDQIPYMTFFRYEGSKGVTNFSGNVTFNDLTVTGNLSLQGTASQFNIEATTINMGENFLKLANGNTSSGNATDLGFYGEYVNIDGTDSSNNTYYAGLLRDAPNGKWILFENSLSSGDSGTTISEDNYAGLGVGSLRIMKSGSGTATGGLHVGTDSSGYIFPTSRGLNGQVLAVDNGGNLNWVNNGDGSSSTFQIQNGRVSDLFYVSNILIGGNTSLKNNAYKLEIIGNANFTNSIVLDPTVDGDVTSYKGSIRYDNTQGFLGYHDGEWSQLGNSSGGSGSTVTGAGLATFDMVSSSENVSLLMKTTGTNRNVTLDIHSDSGTSKLLLTSNATRNTTLKTTTDGLNINNSIVIGDSPSYYDNSNTEGSIRFRTDNGVKKFLGNNGTAWKPLSLWDENTNGSIFYNNSVTIGGSTISNSNFKLEVFGGINCTKLYVGGVLLAPVSGSSSSSETGTFNIHNENKNTSLTVSSGKSLGTTEILFIADTKQSSIRSDSSGNLSINPALDITNTITVTYSINDFYLNGTINKDIIVKEGETYVFDVSNNSNSGKVMKFSTTADGTHGGGSDYTTNIVTSGTPGNANATVTITVNSNTPNVLYYYENTTAGAGGKITKVVEGIVHVDGKMGIKQATPTTELEVNGTTKTSSLIVSSSSPPASSTTTGVKGTITYNNDYLYICIATDTWKRVALDTF
jgi:hypothetical protein